MNILVLGNGFDIAHGLPTKYENFLNFVKRFENFNTSAVKDEDDINNYITNLKNNNLILFNEIDSLTKEKIWLDYFDSIFESRKNEGKDGWIDFEGEISDIIQTLDSARHTLSEQFKKALRIVCASSCVVQTCLCCFLPVLLGMGMSTAGLNGIIPFKSAVLRQRCIAEATFLIEAVDNPSPVRRLPDSPRYS